MGCSRKRGAPYYTYDHLNKKTITDADKTAVRPDEFILILNDLLSSLTDNRDISRKLSPYGMSGFGEVTGLLDTKLITPAAINLGQLVLNKKTKKNLVKPQYQNQSIGNAMTDSLKDVEMDTRPRIDNITHRIGLYTYHKDSHTIRELQKYYNAPSIEDLVNSHQFLFESGDPDYLLYVSPPTLSNNKGGIFQERYYQFTREELDIMDQDIYDSITHNAFDTEKYLKILSPYLTPSQYAEAEEVTRKFKNEVYNKVIDVLENELDLTSILPRKLQVKKELMNNQRQFYTYFLNNYEFSCIRPHHYYKIIRNPFRIDMSDYIMIPVNDEILCIKEKYKEPEEIKAQTTRTPAPYPQAESASVAQAYESYEEPVRKQAVQRSQQPIAIEHNLSPEVNNAFEAAESFRGSTPAIEHQRHYVEYQKEKVENEGRYIEYQKTKMLDDTYSKNKSAINQNALNQLKNLENNINNYYR